jgi:outer membrane receptor protein involved in Fe transport
MIIMPQSWEDVMHAKWIVLLLALLLVPGLLLAGTTGKIKGTVVDEDSKDPLVGANVSLEGTTYGTVTDVNGQYTILNIPAGAYSVKASYIGYTSMVVSNIRVNADLTTSLDMKLKSGAVALQAITIVAERPLVNKSSTNAVRIVNGQDLQSLPVRGIGAVVALQAGVVEQGGLLYIRGGRSDEVGFYVDGADARNAINGRPLVSLVPEAMEEFQVQAGGYNAEYGGANAGIIRTQLRSGTNKYTAQLRAETDNFVSRGQKYLGGYSYGYSDYVLTVGGPIVADKVKFFMAGQHTFTADPTATWWDGFSFSNLAEDAAGSNPNPNATGTEYVSNSGDPNNRVLTIPAGNVPGRGTELWSGNGTLTFDFEPLIVRLSGSMNYSKSLYNIAPIRTIMNPERIPHLDYSSGIFSAKATYIYNPQTFVEGTFSYMDQRQRRYDPLFGDNYLAYGDSLAGAEKGYTYFRRALSPQDIRTNGFPFARPGSVNMLGATGTTTDYRKYKQNYFSGALDITHQYKSHEIKFGGAYQRYTVRQFIIGRLEALLSTLLSNPDDARNGGSNLDLLFRTGGVPNNYGYDIYGRETDSSPDAPKHPTYYSVYAQDKFEFNDLVLNVGLRYDYFDNDDYTFQDPTNPSYDAQGFTIDPATLEKKKAFKTVSPRLGFSFPVTDRTVFHVQYGKFVQAPQLSALYVGNSERARIFSGRNFIPVPFGNGLDPERTTQYEIGFTQQFTDFASFDLTAFYKDIAGQIQASRVTTASGAAAQSYNILQNGDFATTKGFEFTLRIRRIQRIQATLNYTLSDAQGTGSSLTSAISSAEQSTFSPTVISPVQFNQVHRGAINLDYRFAKDDGGPILSQLGANLLFTFNSGHSFTKALASSSGGQRGPEEGAFLGDDDPRSRKPDGAIGAGTTPWVYQLDLRLDKTVSIANMFEVDFYVYVQNLLNTQNVLNVYSRTGNADDDGFLTNPALSSKIVAGQGPQYVNLYRAVNLADRQHYWMDQLNGTNPLEGGDLFGTPRVIRFGLTITY